MIKREPVKQSNQVKVTFVVPHDPAQPRISVLGDFNAWDPKANPLVKRANNTRSVSVTLEPNRQYQFRYRTEDGEWLDDEQADGYAPNEFGTQNCLIVT
jgi:1,4-alpha-glucan branching enzyme